MYCRRCRREFSSRGDRNACPRCGALPDGSGSRASTIDAAEASTAGEAVGTRRRQRTTGTELEVTRTEVGPRAVWEPGTVLAGKYEVLSCLGSGGFGTVYKVRHNLRKKYYALKTPHLAFVRDELFQRRFEREIEAMERFVHPDAVTIRDSGMTEAGRPYYTMDFVDGESLRTVIEREGQLSPQRAARLVGRILSVLNVAHEHHILHRDIKPDNFILTWTQGEETVKVLDFGVAKLLDRVNVTGTISGGERVGTPRYMSPEQILGETLSVRSDLFSLGIVFYEMVTGRHPFGVSDEVADVTREIVHGVPSPPEDLVEALSGELSDLIVEMLEKDPAQRPPSAADARESLEIACRSLYARAQAPVALSVIEAAPRQRAEALVLRRRTKAGEQRHFLFFGDETRFGRSRGEGAGGLILRRLPCRSADDDPQNWRQNLTISNSLGIMYPDGSAFVIETSPGAKYGVTIGGVGSQQRARIHAGQFHLSLGDRALELDGFRVRRSDDALFDLSVLASGRPAGAVQQARTGYSNPACRIDSVCLRRLHNWPLHEYHLVYRVVRVGAAATSGLRLSGEGVAGMQALIVFEAGEAFLLPLEAGVEATLEGDGRERMEVAPYQLLPLTPGLLLAIGRHELLVDGVSDRDFKVV